MGVKRERCGWFWLSAWTRPILNIIIILFNFYSVVYFSRPSRSAVRLSVCPSVRAVSELGVNIFTTLGSQTAGPTSITLGHRYSMGRGTKLLGSRNLNFGPCAGGAIPNLARSAEMNPPRTGVLIELSISAKSLVYRNTVCNARQLCSNGDFSCDLFISPGRPGPGYFLK